MGDAGFMISSIMNAGFQNQPGATYNFPEQSAFRNYSYSPSGSEPDFCIETPPPNACNLVSSTTMPTISNGGYASITPDLQQQVAALPSLHIVEEPQSKIRYRYASEKGAHGGMQGESSGSAKKTFPTVQLKNAPQGKVYIKASLYTSERTPRLHVHKLSGKNCDDNGECVVDLNEDRVAMFQGLGINYTRKNEVNKILLQRIFQSFVGDEAQLKETAESESKTMKENLNSVRICFQAFNADNVPICPPEFSRPVQNQKSSDSGDLRITKISLCAGACTGNDEVFLLCEKVNKKDIRIRFFEENTCDNWESYANFSEADVHHQVAIVFRTPAYKDPDIQQPVTVFLELYRVKDGERSEARPFTYRPVEKDEDRVAQKRKKLDCGDYSYTSHPTQHSFAGTSTVGLRTSRTTASYSQGHISPSYQSRGSSSQAQESAVAGVGLQVVPDSDYDDISDLMTFNRTSSTESSAGVSSTTDISIRSPSALFDEEMSTSTVDQHSPSLLRLSDPMWSVGSSSSGPGDDDDDTANQSVFTSDYPSLQQRMPRSIVPDDVRIQSMRSVPVLPDAQSAEKLHRSSTASMSLSELKKLLEKPQHQLPADRKGRRITLSGEMSDADRRDIMRRTTCGAVSDDRKERKLKSGVMTNTDRKHTRRMFTSCDMTDTDRKVMWRYASSGFEMSEADRDDWRISTNTRSGERPILTGVPQGSISGGDMSKQKIGKESQHGLPSSRIGTMLHSRGSAETTPGRDVRTIVQNVSRALRRFLASGDVQLLLYPMRDLMGVTDEDGDNAVHHIALHQGSEPQFVDSSLPVVQHLPHAVINQTNNRYQTPLQLAVAVRKLNVLKWLLACGANPNVQDMQGHSAIHLSVLKHNHDCLSILLEKKLRPKHKPDLNLLNYKGVSPLHMAVLEGCQTCVQSLCVAGADVNTRNGICGRTALHLAVEHRTELLDVLLDQENVLVDTQDYAGNTALHLACIEDNLEAALKLMRMEANPLIENFNKCIDQEEQDESDEEEDESDEEDENNEKLKGKTPFDLAEGNETMRNILAGVNVSRLDDESTSTSSSKEKKLTSRHFSTDVARPKEKEAMPTSTDSGFISAEITDGLSRLCELLDPPNAGWKKLAEVLWDPKQIDQLAKLEKSPTRALLRNYEEDQYKGILRMAEMEEFVDVLRNENPVH